MPERRVARGALVCSLLFACGERAGDPVVALASDQRQAGGAQQPDPADTGGGTGSSDPPASARGPIGLCGECSSSADCGDANDACLHHDGTSFCGRDCDDQRGCPDQYACVEVGGTQLFQCVPENGCPTPSLATPSLADIRDHILMRINSERKMHNRMPLDTSSCLDQLAQDSALDFARTDEPLGKYVRECDGGQPSCACGWAAEAELTVARYALDWSTAIDHALGSSRVSGDDRFVQAFLDNDLTRVGIGFWLSGDEAWLALSFH